MKLRSLTPIALIITIFSLLLIVSCKKENSSSGSDTQEEEVSKVSSESDSQAEIIFNGLFDDVMGVDDNVGMAGIGIFGRAAVTGPGEVQRPNACFTVTVTHLSPPNLFPVRVVIDFGTTSCMGVDGHTRRGQIITEYSNRLIFPGAIAVTTFNNFYFDSIKVEGTHKITNTSSATPLSRQFKAEVINGKLTNYNGNYIEWNSLKTITQIEGMITTNFPRDDAFRIEGNSRGRALRGNLLVGWESTIIEPLIKRFDCRWIVKGKVKTVRLNANTNPRWVAVLDFGNGVCDRRAVITINGVPHEITLP